MTFKAINVFKVKAIASTWLTPLHPISLRYQRFPPASVRRDEDHRHERCALWPSRQRRGLRAASLHRRRPCPAHCWNIRWLLRNSVSKPFQEENVQGVPRSWREWLASVYWGGFKSDIRDVRMSLTSLPPFTLTFQVPFHWVFDGGVQCG